MVSVTYRVKHIEQPRGGYLPISKFDKIVLNDGNSLHSSENVEPYIIGTVVDYLSRWQQTKDLNKAFLIPIIGGIKSGRIDETTSLLEDIVDLSDESLTNACRLVYFDAYARGVRPDTESFFSICPDSHTCDNIRTMVERSCNFFDDYGPVVEDGFLMKGGYGRYIDSGDGDFLTKDTVWEFKVLRNAPNSNHTLQLLVYYIMGKRSTNSNFDNISKLGIFNPRLNVIYKFEMSNLGDRIVSIVKRDVIGYDCE